MARKLQDQDNKELEAVLQALLAEDVGITAREVARRHSALASASTITRHPVRRQLLESYQNQQAEMRRWRTKLGKRSKEQTAELLTKQEAKVLELEHAVTALVAGHVSLIAAVAQVGGMAKLSKFYDRFREIRDELSRLNAIPTEFPLPNAIDIWKSRNE